MIGHTADMYKPYAENTSVYPLSDVGTVNTNRKINHLQLKEENYICFKDFGFAEILDYILPQIALQYHKLKLMLNFDL